MQCNKKNAFYYDYLFANKKFLSLCLFICLPYICLVCCGICFLLYKKLKPQLPSSTKICLTSCCYRQQLFFFSTHFKFLFLLLYANSIKAHCVLSLLSNSNFKDLVVLCCLLSYSNFISVCIITLKKT